MDTTSDRQAQKDGLETTIKVLTILKLIIQLAFYGVMLGTVIWFLLDNPIPGLIEDLQSKMFGGGYGL